MSSPYILLPRQTRYAKGVHALREDANKDPNSQQPTWIQADGSSIIRPLSFRETIKARVNDYESPTPSNDRLRLFHTWLDSCTGYASKKESTKFKLIPQCKELITLPQTFNEYALPIDYNTIQGIKLDTSTAKYNQRLTKQEVLNHPAWREALEQDLPLLKTYTDIIFAELKKPKGAMVFYVRSNFSTDGLRALLVDNLLNISLASGSNDLSNRSRFVREVVPAPTGAVRREKIGRLSLTRERNLEGRLTLEQQEGGLSAI